MFNIFPKEIHEGQYLGEGVYIQINEAGQWVLTTGRQRLSEADNVVYLEPEVCASLVDYINRHKKS